MPLYEFRCRECDVRFEERRSMDDADQPASCPSGHVGAMRLLPVFATTGHASMSGPVCGPVAGGGGCCGGACGCS